MTNAIFFIGKDFYRPAKMASEGSGSEQYPLRILQQTIRMPGLSNAAQNGVRGRSVPGEQEPVGPHDGGAEEDGGKIGKTAEPPVF